MAISKKTWTGTAKEATPGTAVTTPTMYIPTVCTFKGGKKYVYFNEERGDRTANYGVLDSIRQTAIDLKGPFYPDTSPIQFWAMFGLPSTATDVGSWKHTFASPFTDIPATYTIFRHLDAKSYYVPYASEEKFTLHYTVDGKTLELDSSWLGLYSVINGTPPTPSFSSVLPLIGYAPVVKFLDGVASTDVIDMQIEVTQKIELWYPGNNSPDFVTVYFGERAATIDITARFDNDTLYQRWRTTGGTMDTLNFDLMGPIASGAVNYELNIQIPNIHWDTMEHDTTKTNVLIKAKGTVVPPGGFNSTIMSGFVVNNVSSYTT